MFNFFSPSSGPTNSDNQQISFTPTPMLDPVKIALKVQNDYMASKATARQIDYWNIAPWELYYVKIIAWN